MIKISGKICLILSIFFARQVLNHDDDLNSSLKLMRYFDEVPAATVERWFTRNYAYNVYDKGAAPLTKAMQDLVLKQSDRWQDYHDECLEAYYDAFPAAKPDLKSKKAKAGKSNSRSAPK